MIVHDATTAWIAVIHWAIGWVMVGAAVTGMAGCAGVLLVAPGVKAARKRLSGPSWARGRVRARIHARSRVRRSSGRTRPRMPHWARTQPIRHHDYEEAA